MLVRKFWIQYIINSDVHFVGYLYIMDLINARKMEHIKMHIFNIKEGIINQNNLTITYHMHMFHANIFNFTAMKFGTCYRFSKQITEDGLDKVQGMLGRKQTVVILHHICMSLVLDIYSIDTYTAADFDLYFVKQKAFQLKVLLTN
jgi:hypothetical protein